jgi:hypothetical protein
MQVGFRSILLGAAALIVLSGCDFSSPWGSSSAGSQYGATGVSSNSGGGTGTGSGSGTTTAPPGGVGGEGQTNGSDDTVISTVNVSEASVTVGASQTVSITFNSSDGLPTTGFGISGSLATLPAGWSGPPVFTCAMVSTGSGCVLNLTYTPTAADSGTVTLSYIYIDNAGLSKVPGGTVTIPYQAIAANNVIATAYPSGQINAAVGSGMQSVTVNFTTDTSNAALDAVATNLSVTTNLASLPAGWTSAAMGLSCAIVFTGNGCQLVLEYAPTAAGRGTLTLNYGFTDDTGTARTGSINIPYSTTTANTVSATASPSGQITAAIKGGSQSVAVTFVTDDGKAASGLIVTSNLKALPAGWASASSGFTCGSVSTGNGCQLRLTYAPTALGSGTLAITYAYTDSAGQAQTGTLDLPYAATTNDTVTATPSPSGQITAVVGMGAQNVAVTFTTDDGRLATALTLATGSLTTLPAGWTSTATSFGCTTVSSGSACQLNLSYNPPARTAGTLMINYTYRDNANQTKTGSFSIPYRSTTNDTVVGTPSQPSVAVIVGNSTTVNVLFATNDGNPASTVSVTGLGTALPAGWSGPSTFSCATVSDGTVCQLSLTYRPTAVGAGTVTLPFTYVNDAGFNDSGTVAIDYRANSNDTVGAMANPTSVSVPAATGSQTVTFTFTTSDGAPATNLTMSLTSLPTGWTGPGPSFSCGSVSNGTPCTLTLTYAPATATSGTLQLQLPYTYTNNAGTADQGSVTFSYSAT